MINNQRILAVIPARGGSKGVPRKNVRHLGDKPLIAWTIEEAKKSKYIDRLILTSDNHEIIEVAKNYGCEVPFIRPSELAEDNTPGMDPILHAINQIVNYDFIVELQPTSPLRIVDDIDGCIESCLKNEWKACVSVSEAKESPYWMFNIGKSGLLQGLLGNKVVAMQRQKLPPVYILNGAIYIANIEWLKVSKTFLTEETGAYVMPQNRSLDIDTEIDFCFAEHIMKH